MRRRRTRTTPCGPRTTCASWTCTACCSCGSRWISPFPTTGREASRTTATRRSCSVRRRSCAVRCVSAVLDGATTASTAMPLCALGQGAPVPKWKLLDTRVGVVTPRQPPRACAAVNSQRLKRMLCLNTMRARLGFLLLPRAVPNSPLITSCLLPNTLPPGGKHLPVVTGPSGGGRQPGQPTSGAAATGAATPLLVLRAPACQVRGPVPARPAGGTRRLGTTERLTTCTGGEHGELSIER